MPVGCYLTVSRSTHELRFRLARRHGSAVAGDESLSGPLAGGPARRVKGYLPALPDGKLVARFSSVAELTGVSDAWMGGTSVGSGRRAQVFHFRKIDDQKEVQLQIVAASIRRRSRCVSTTTVMVSRPV